MIDAHQHFWKYDPQIHEWISDEMSLLRKDFLPEDLASVANDFQLEGTIAVQADQSEAETNFLIALAKKNPFIKGVIGWTDLRSSNLSENLSRYKSQKIVKGFRHVVQNEPKGFLSDHSFIAGVNAIGQHGFTYDLLIYHHQLDEALAFASKTSNVMIVVDHIAKPSIRTGQKTHWELKMAALATFPNVYCKLSGMITEANWSSWTYENIEPFMDEVFESFGADRIMYGSDWPVCLLAGSYDQQFQLVNRYISRLTETEKAKVLGENAKRFYNL